jgi:hypothetical protein
MEIKICKDCNKEKNISEFYKISGKEYYHAYCKICHSKKTKLDGIRNRDKEKSKIGFIYILENPLYPNYIKIGKTIHLNSRLTTYNTCSPFRDYYFSYVIETENYKLIENYFKNKFLCKTEWYEMSKDQAIDIIKTLL